MAVIIPGADGRSVTPGAQLSFMPSNLTRVPSNTAGMRLNQCTFELRDQDGKLVDTRGEEWSVQLLIEYNT